MFRSFARLPLAVGIRTPQWQKTNCTLNLSTCSPHEPIDFVMRAITVNDYDKVREFVVREFPRNEPTCQGFGNPTEFESVIKYLTDFSMVCPFSRLITERNGNEMIGVRLMSIYNRDGTSDHGQPPQFTGNVATLVKMLEYLKAGFWLFAPVDVNRILMREITMVLPHYRRHGIAQHLLHLDLPDSTLKAASIDGIFSAASSLANQTLLSKNGYEPVTSVHHRIIQKTDGNFLRCADGTTAMIGFFRRI